MKIRRMVFTLMPLVFLVLGAVFLNISDRYFHQRLKQETQFAFDSLMQAGVNRAQSLVVSESLQSAMWQVEMYAHEVGFIAVFLWGLA